ncbi:MAG TPA: 50S ribosomal protein L11 [Methanomicrobia archaeon]|nr:MAG: 50S ribosomal protein L11 [Thermococci archaeon]RLF94529.1 MAG: 50S ribosomal protein L11 [Thermococci archaeon]RLG01095.1 MAG: 50S ribosomal protein L11 [Thermococci archaeon]HDN81222.1 50S ribosomal protein L11 [Methanomicrobia archaeon]HEC87818.1 50S ribosomal protein L11 [Thermoplasmata archaeon]
MAKTTIESLVDGGRASAGPPLGPALGPLGINIGKIIEEINKKTKDFEGMKVPVKIIVDEKKNFEIVVGTPPTSSLILKELNLEKGSQKPGSEIVGDMSIEKVLKIAKMKREGMLSEDIKSNVKEVLGTCLSIGVNVDGKNPKQVIEEIDEGKYEEIIG